MLSNIKIGHRLGIGFGIVVLFSGLVGVVAIMGMSKLASLTSALYSSPFTNTNALYDIQNNATSLHQNMAGALQAISLKEREQHFQQTQIERHNIGSHLRILKQNFLSKHEELKQIQLTLKRWDETRNKVTQLIENDKFELAENLIHTDGTRNLNNIKLATNQLIRYERDVAKKLHTTASETKNILLLEMYTLLALILSSGIFISIYISRSITNPLYRIVAHVKPIAKGDLKQKIDIYSKDEVGLLADSFRDLVNNLRHKAFIADKITNGDLQSLIKTQTNIDQLGNSMNKMILSLRQSEQRKKDLKWTNEGISTLNQLMQGEQSVTQLCQVIIDHLAHYLNSLLGSIYIFRTTQQTLEFRAGYAFSNETRVKKSFNLGEGLIGQAARNSETLILDQLPEDYARIQSSIGKTRPRHLVVTSLFFENQLIGILELAFLNKIDPLSIDLMETVREDIGIALNSAKSRNKISSLLLESERQAEELQQQQLTLQKTNEELEEQTSNLIESEQLLKNQQDKLRKTNAQLEETTESLENQKQDTEQKNIALLAAGEEIKAKIEELEQSSQYKSEFLANMSHELRTPLNSLLLLARMLKENIDENLNDEQIKSAAIIYNAGNDLLHLINDILDLSKIEAGQMDIHHEQIQMATLSQSIHATFSHLVEEKGLDFQISISKTLPQTFYSDFKRLDQVIKNLLSNAIKFTKEGEINISFEKHPLDGEPDAKEYLTISIKDTGIGISPEKKHVIFEEFKQAEGGISRKFGGTGLGLSISKKLTTLLGGTITVQSKLGIGSTFNLNIPLTTKMPQNNNSENSTTLSLQPSSNSTIFKPETILQNKNIKHSNMVFNINDDINNITPDDTIILIIEDDENFAKVLIEQARKSRFKAIVSDNAAYGLQLANQHTPNAILLDIKLPDISGLQVLDILKSDAKTRHIPVHVMSISEVENEVTQRGAIGFLQKPINEKQLAEAFNHISLITEKKVKDLLLIEDDTNAQESIKTLIGNSDVIINTVKSGLEAEKEITKKDYDCIVLDLGLSDITGLELLDRLQKNEDITIPPVIVYTGKDLSQKEVNQLREYSQSIIIKGVKSEDRLLDETALFLHRVIGNLPKKKQKMIMDLHDQDAIFKGKTLLIVDDDMRNVFALSQLLTEKGFNIIKAEDGEKGLKRLKENPNISLILMDMMMPNMDGLETIKHIREQKKYSDLPIIALTAKAMREDRENCISAGANDYLAKPVDVTRLLSMLRVWLYQV